MTGARKTRRGLTAGNFGRGSHWIRDRKRRRIYWRDGLRCVYCGASTCLTLDHVLPRAKGGKNDADNLVTACSSCNETRGDQPVVLFIGTLPNPGEVFARVLDSLGVPLP